MTKKRIADLLKEEVEKPAGSSSAGKTSTDNASKETGKAPRAKAGTRKRSTATSSTAKAATAKSTAAKAASKPAATKSSATKSSATKSTAAKDTKSADLAAELAAALKKANEQIGILQEDVDTHQERIFELKDSLKAAEGDSKKKDTKIKKLTSDLEASKQTIVKLTEAAEQASKAASKTAASTSIRAAASDKKTAAKKAEDSKSLAVQSRRPYSSYKSIPEYAIQRGTPAGGQSNSMMDDDDIGWVD